MLDVPPGQGGGTVERVEVKGKKERKVLKKPKSATIHQQQRPPNLEVIPPPTHSLTHPFSVCLSPSVGPPSLRTTHTRTRTHLRTICWLSDWR